jgi:hypothetical protein
MPTPARKAPARKKTPAQAAVVPPTPADASPAEEATVPIEDGLNAAEQALAEVNADSITVTFRGQEFVIERAILTSARFMLAMASGQGHNMMFELLGPVDSGRFIDLCERGEQLPDVTRDWFDALNATAGTGN